MTIHGVTFEYNRPDCFRSTLWLEIAMATIDALDEQNWPSVFAANLAMGSLLAAAGRVGYENGLADENEGQYYFESDGWIGPYPERQP